MREREAHCGGNYLCSGYMTESGGSVSDYINTAIHGHYDTDFPELTSKFEKFSIGSSNHNAAALF